MREASSQSHEKAEQLCVIQPQRNEFFQQLKGACEWILPQLGLQMKMQSSPHLCCVWPCETLSRGTSQAAPRLLST